MPQRVTASSPAQGFLGGDLQIDLLQVASPESQRNGTDYRRMLVGEIVDVPIASLLRAAGVTEQVTGDVSCHFRATSWDDLATLNGVAEIRVPRVAVRGASLKELSADVAVHDGAVEAEFVAHTCGGRAAGSLAADAVKLSRLSPDELADPSQLPFDLSASIDDIELAELWPVIGQQRQLRRLRGRGAAQIVRGDAERKQHALMRSNLQLRDLRWENVLWSSQISSEIIVRPDRLELRELTGPFCGGRVSARGQVSLDADRSGTFEASASRIALQTALAPIDRRGELATGRLSLQTRGRLGRRPSGHTQLSMDRGTAGPIAFSTVRIPIDWSVDPATQSAQWRTTNANIELGGGRVISNGKGRWSGRLDATLSTAARRVDLGRILRGTVRAGGGLVDGNLRLVAKRATNVNDVNGTFDATLRDANTLQIPVISDLATFLTTLPTSTSVADSKIEGRLGNGLVHLERVTVAAANAQILAEGTASLQGRLNLQVTARTDESGPADKLLELADSPLVMAAPTPIGMVAKANAALKDRVVHLRVGGTAARPVIRLEPGRQLGKEAIKFFMNQAIALRKKSDEQRL